MNYTLYCMYHDVVWPQLYGNRLDDVTFVKLGSHRSSFRPPTRLDLTQFSDFREMGKHYAEFEFFYNLYLAYRNGEVELPEFMGIIQYDMVPRSTEGHCLFTYLDRLILHRGVFVSFVPRGLAELRNQRIRMNDMDCYAAIAAEYNHFFKTRHQLAGNPRLPMCSSFFAHREVYLKIMEFIAPVIEDARLESYNKEFRLQGGLLERYLAVSVVFQKLEMKEFHLVHSFKEGTGQTPFDILHPPSTRIRIPLRPVGNVGG